MLRSWTLAASLAAGGIGIAAASVCGIGDWGKSGVIVYRSGCTITAVNFTCGGALGNQVIVTDIVGEMQVEGCMLV